MDYQKKKKDDRRVKRTKRLLKDSLAALLMEKNLNEISVKELVDRADINRGTFYLHYRDIYDMLAQIENEMIADLEEITDKFPASVVEGFPKPYLLEVFRYIAENLEFCRMLLGPNGDMAFVDKLKKMVEEKSLLSIKAAYPENTYVNYQFFAAYNVAGCVGLLQNWIESGMKITPEELAEVADDLIRKGIDFLTHPVNKL